MRRIANISVLLTLLAVWGNTLGQEVFTGKVVYRHKLTNPEADYPAVDSTILTGTKEFTLIERFYAGRIAWSYPAMEVATAHERLLGYGNSPEVAFASPNKPVSTEIVSVEDAEPVLGYACKRVVTRKQMPSGAYLKRNYLVATAIPGDSFGALFPRELAGMPLACEVFYEDKQGNHLFSEIIEAVRVERTIDEAPAKEKAAELGTRKRADMNWQNFKKEMGVAADLSTAVDFR